VAKNQRTSDRFKKIVRALKNLRDELVESKIIGTKQLPSFLIECLAYRVEDHFFLQDETRLARMKRILTRISQQLIDSAWLATAAEINDSKLLFMPGQSWDVPTTQACIRLALQRLEV
jgi:hypothetical protein